MPFSRGPITGPGQLLYFRMKNFLLRSGLHDLIRIQTPGAGTMEAKDQGRLNNKRRQHQEPTQHVLVILTDFHGPEAAPHCYQLSKNTESFLEKFPQGQDSPSNPPNLLMAKLP